MTRPQDISRYSADRDTEYPNPYLTEESLLHVDADDPTKYIDKRRQVSLLKRAAHTLRTRYGLGEKGPDRDVVQLLASGHYMLPTAFYGVIAAGGSVSSSQPSAPPEEVARQLQLTESSLMICTFDLKGLALEAAKKAKLPLDRVLILGDGHDLEFFEGTTGKAVPISSEMLEWRRLVTPESVKNTTAAFLYSSGTTGLPKAVCLSHGNMVSSAVLLISNRRDDTHKQEGYRTIAHLPAAHIAGMQGYFVNPVYIGGPVYWMPRFDFPKFLQYNKKYRITQFFSVPPVFLAIAKSPLVTDQFDTLEFAMSGAAPLGKDIQALAARKLGKGTAILSQTWGLSETTGGFTVMPRNVRDETGSVSMVVPNCEARIVDDQGKDVEPGERGEIWVKGPIVFKGYFKNDQANREAFIDGWFCTGDICLFREGMIYCVDRKKVCQHASDVVLWSAHITLQELIKFKGSQVAPAELEALLLTHPNIQDAAVIGVKGEGTEVPR
jgi:4-coumarate--CoA ligase